MPFRLDWLLCWSLQVAISMCVQWMVILLRSAGCSIHLSAMNGPLAEVCRLQYPSVCNEWSSCWDLQVAITICVQWMVILLRSAGCNNHLCAMNGHLAEICRLQYPSVRYEWSSFWDLQIAVSICLPWMVLLLKSAWCSIHLCAMNVHLAEICRLQYPSICYMNGSLSEVFRMQ